MDFINIVIIAISEFLVAIFSSVAQGGGNYIILPLMLGVDVTPVAASAALTVSNLGFSSGNILGLKGVHVKDKQTLLVLMVLGSLTGLGVPFILAHMSSYLYSLIIGIFIILITPIMHFKPFGVESTETTNKQKIKGYMLLALIFVVARFTLGVGALFTYVLSRYCGHSVIEANLTRKVAGLVGSSVTAVGVIVAGFVNWPITISLTVSSILGGYIGARIVVKKGNAWTAKVLSITMLASGVILIFTSLK